MWAESCASLLCRLYCSHFELCVSFLLQTCLERAGLAFSTLLFTNNICQREPLTSWGFNRRVD